MMAVELYHFWPSVCSVRAHLTLAGIAIAPFFQRLLALGRDDMWATETRPSVSPIAGSITESTPKGTPRPQTLIDSLHGLDGGWNIACVSYHVWVCEVENDHVVLP